VGEVLGLELRASPLGGRHSTTRATPPALTEFLEKADESAEFYDRNNGDKMEKTCIDQRNLRQEEIKRS
jgi:hypothetical protein